MKVVSISSSHSDSDLTANRGSSSDLTTRGFGFIREEFSSRRRLLIFNLQFFQRRTFKVLVIRAFFFPNRLDWRVLNSRRHKSYTPRTVPPHLPIEQQSRVAGRLNSKIREEKVAGQGKGKTGQLVPVHKRGFASACPQCVHSVHSADASHVHSVSTLTRPPLSASTKALRSFFTQFHPGTRRQKLKDTPTL